MKKTALPVPGGEYAVGTTTFTVYNDRAETMYCAAGSSRHVPARVYYPADKAAAAGLPKAKHMSEAMTKAIARTFYIPLSYPKLEKEGKNTAQCYPDAPFPEGKKFPLLLFSHGYGSFREGNSFLCIELASRGYVVISVGHPYEALLTEFDDGTSVPAAKGIAARLYSPLLPSVAALLKLRKAAGTNEELAAQFDALQKKYCTFSIERIPEWKKDSLAALRYAKAHFAQIIDFSCGVGVSGHSFGGATAYALCLDEPEFTCGINMDGGLFGDYEGKTLHTPFLQINCEANKTAVARGFLHHTEPVYHAVLRDMQHLGFSDMKHFVSMKSQMGKLDPQAAHDAVCGLHAAFFDACLKKTRERPALESGGAVTLTAYAPDA